MNRYWLHSILFAVIMLAAITQLACYYPHLPDQVATHFNHHGHPDDWSAKSTFLVIQIVIFAGISVLFGGLCLLLPVLPNSLINLPHKEFWLAPARRDYSLEVMRNFLVGFGNLTLALIVGVMHLSMRANLAATPRLSHWFWVLFGGYVLGTCLLLGRLLYLFKRPAS